MSDPPCTGVWPLADRFIADLGLSLAYLHDDQFFPCWTVLDSSPRALSTNRFPLGGIMSPIR